jgi:hypothetical protein
MTRHEAQPIALGESCKDQHYLRHGKRCANTYSGSTPDVIGRIIDQHMLDTCRIVDEEGVELEIFDLGEPLVKDVIVKSRDGIVPRRPNALEERQGSCRRNWPGKNRRSLEQIRINSFHNRRL